jgi:tetratricopeptide (TPR) repeat protein
VTDSGPEDPHDRDIQPVSVTASDHSTAIGSVGTMNVNADQVQFILQAAADQRASTAVYSIGGLSSSESQFVGRQDELARTSEMLKEQTVAKRVVAISGPPGAGKTALAKRAAETAAGSGLFVYALFADMRGYEPDPASKARPEGVLPSLLRRLGVPAEEIPSTPGEQETFYHHWLDVLAAHGKAVLLFLDNVSDVAQFETLQPSGTLHKLLLTTRETFGVVPSHAVIEIDVLSEPDALLLLTTAIGSRNPDDARLAQDADMAIELVKLCDRLPLALLIVAALLADEPARPVADVVAELQAEERRLDALHYDQRLSVRAALNLSYQHLPEPLKRLFRLLSVVPGGDVGLDAARWLVESDGVRPNLMLLVRAHLVQQHVINRWSMHDLVRIYSAEEAADVPEDAERAYKSVIGNYTLRAGAAIEWLTAVSSDTGKQFFSSPQAAADWMESERSTLIAIVMSAVQRAETRQLAAHLGIVLGDYLKSERHLLNEFHDVAAVTASVAMMLDDKRLGACVLNNYGSALRLRGESEEALGILSQAVALNEENSDVAGASTSRSNIANVLVDQGKYEEAIAIYLTDIEVCRSSDPPHPHHEAGSLTNLAAAYGLLERSDDAVRALGRAVQLRRSMNNLPGLANSLLNLGAVLQQAAAARGDVALMRKARAALEEARDIYRDQLHNESGQAMVANNLGVVQCQLRDFGNGIPNLEFAVDYFERTDQTARAGATREVLDEFRRAAQRS